MTDQRPLGTTYDAIVDAVAPTVRGDLAALRAHDSTEPISLELALPLWLHIGRSRLRIDDVVLEVTWTVDLPADAARLVGPDGTRLTHVAPAKLTATQAQTYRTFRGDGMSYEMALETALLI